VILKTFQSTSPVRLTWKLPAAAAAAVLIGHVLVLSLLRDQHLRMVVSDVFLPVESTAAAGVFVFAALRERTTGKRAFAAWLLLAIAYISIAASDLQWSGLEIFGGVTPFPSVGNVVYLFSYPTFFVGALLLSQPSARGRTRQMLDIGIIVLSAMLALWVFLLSPVLVWTPHVTSLLFVIGILYLVGDLALVSTLAVLAFRRGSTMLPSSRWFLTASILARMVADSLFSFQLVSGVSANGNASDAAYALSSLCAFAAALAQIFQPTQNREATSRSTTSTRLRDLMDWRTSLPFLGILVVFFVFLWSRAHPFPLGDVVLAMWAGTIVAFSITRQILESVENARLSRELDLRVQERTIRLTEANLELFLLSQVRTALAKELELSAVLKTIVETVAETLGYSMVSLYLLQRDQLVFQYDVGYERRLPCIPITSGVTGRVARTGKPALVANTRDDPDFLSAVEGVASEITVPLLDQGAVEGVLSVESLRRDAFDESDLRLLTEVADYAAIAIVRARFFSLLRESEERYRRLIETSPDAIVLTDAELGIIVANQKAAELFGYDSADQLSSLRARDFVDPADRNSFDAAVRDVLESGTVVPMELGVIRRGGKEVPVEASASAVTGPQGAFAGLLIIARDITHRKRIEAELREYQEELERRVDERTSALQESQERLRQAEKMEAVGRLAGGVAHDFNNMLMVIMGHGQLLLETEDLAGDRRRELAAMLESAERAASLTHQLLTFSRQQLVEVQALDLNAVIDGMSDMVARLVGEHVKLEFRPAQELWSVLTDKVQMEQVVLNLAANAADAMKNGGVIEIETSNVRVEEPIPLQLVIVPPGRYVLVRVKDSGEGMPAEVQEHVFEPFFTTKEKGKGTGLGLATVYGIVKQAKGFISLESAPGQGATFRIYLPAYELDAVAEQGNEGVKQAPGGTESILVVDDQDEVRGIAVLMLRNLGYTVYEAGGGNEALALLGRLSRLPDLVITDVSMPEVTGPALMRQLFTSGSGPKTIYMSGYGRDAFDRTMTDAVFLQKPFSALTLALAVRNVLDSGDLHGA